MTGQIKCNFIGEFNNSQVKSVVNEWRLTTIGPLAVLYRVVYMRDIDMWMQMDEILEMRNNYDGFKMFVLKFLKEVVGKKQYKERVGSGLVSTIATCSDEAFAYLTLENNFNIWTEIAEHR